jgi:hypothetical protein
MTEEEFAYYQQICRSYDRPSFKGEALFDDLFETDNNGLIVFVKPPSQKYTSMEVFCFVLAIMNHQHLRLMHSKVEGLCSKLRDKIAEANKLLSNINSNEKKENKNG